ncbi:non-ribosomal peptide synthetase component F [Arthrobacter sp. V4I6]|nr:non-ribosomal peptide synthetase component F [Arthrobacter sp. V4I6]
MMRFTMSQQTPGATTTQAPGPTSSVSTPQHGDAFENLSHENRRFAPSAEFARNAVVTDADYAEADADRPAFWAKQARELLTWSKDFDQALDWSNPPFAKWFVGGEVNAAYNALDRHVKNGHGDRVAIYFEGEPGDTRSYTYAQLTEEVKKAANAFESLGVVKGDRVAVYLPMIPEAVITLLACARIGAIHSVVFGGFSADALRSRIDDAEARLVVTADGTYRRGKPSALKPAVDEALAHNGHTVQNVVVVKRNGQDVDWHDGRDHWWADTVGLASPEHTAVGHDSEHPLFILYTSGTTGKPKGILHTTGGYLTQTAYTHKAVFDLHPETDVYWCTADVGWITGHSYVAYAPFINGATQVIYEGTPDSPHQGRWWEIVEKYKVSILYTAPTAIRTFMKWGKEIPARSDLSSIRVLGSVGEPIKPRGVDVVPRGHRRQCRQERQTQRHPGPDRRHLVADRNRGADDRPTARRDGHQARLRPGPAPRNRRGRRGRARRIGAQRARRVPGDPRTVAGHAARHLGRPGAVQRHLLVPLRGHVLRR